VSIPGHPREASVSGERRAGGRDRSLRRRQRLAVGDRRKLAALVRFVDLGQLGLCLRQLLLDGNQPGSVDVRDLERIERGVGRERAEQDDRLDRLRPDRRPRRSGQVLAAECSPRFDASRTSARPHVPQRRIPPPSSAPARPP
jgi:hypothetical protein